MDELTAWQLDVLRTAERALGMVRTLATYHASGKRQRVTMEDEGDSESFHTPEGSDSSTPVRDSAEYTIPAPGACLWRATPPSG